jgi:hypothetical protein
MSLAGSTPVEPEKPPCGVGGLWAGALLSRAVGPASLEPDLTN